MHAIKRFSILIFLSVFYISCSKTTIDENASQLTPYTDYFTIQVGQSILYRLDSTVLLAFGTDTTTHTYWQKDSVMSVTSDLTGGLQYNVNSYIKPFVGNYDWQFLTSYRVTPTVQNLQLVDEDNLRFIKLVSPVVDGFSWDGNAYFMKNYQPSADDPLSIYQNWNYQYTDKDSIMNLKTGIFSNTVTVKQIDTANAPSFDPAEYYARSLSVESYAKGIGLIHKKLLFLTWQNSGQSVGYQSGSYGIELTRVQ
ncbi:MAG: hypothetical protein DI598_11515 [Pseudopedobacter saltans]|uniref:Uncharacterized protein n=1 Tax=Pseudopedobacter saltans TaxID=151895 RepID=A0A2W5EUE4_9SPHI|nr:MAG: hypothetical protein DI598_11515 [Pseudopedobacter saltans]